MPARQNQLESGHQRMGVKAISGDFVGSWKQHIISMTSLMQYSSQLNGELHLIKEMSTNIGSDSCMILQVSYKLNGIPSKGYA